jgi:hypothetical protein
VKEFIPSIDYVSLPQSFILMIIENIKLYFNHSSFLTYFIETFNPNVISDALKDKDIYMQKRIQYGILICYFKPLFTDLQYRQKFLDYDLFLSLVSIKLSSLKTNEDVCYFILKYPSFASIPTTVV